jgi:hypothetical protein
MTNWNSTELQTQHSNIYDEKKYKDYVQLGKKFNQDITRKSTNTVTKQKDGYTVTAKDSPVQYCKK